MSYDGGLSVKIINPVIEGILKKYNGTNLDLSMYLNDSYKGNKLSFSFENLDCADVSCYPNSLDDVAKCMLNIIDFYIENEPYDHMQYKAFKKELNDNVKAILDSYEYVSWVYYPSDDEDEDEEKTFSYGKIKRAKRSSKQPKNLYEIFPNINTSAVDTGLTHENGVFIDYSESKHNEYLGVSSGSHLYLPEFIFDISDDTEAFFSPFSGLDTFVFTTNIIGFPEVPFAALGGINNFYIIDPNTKNVVFYTDNFRDDDHRGVMPEVFDDFAEAYEDDKDEALSRKW